MSIERCAACKCFRRRCPSDCIFYPYFPATHPQRFACVRTIYKACNVEKMLQQIPEHQRGEAVECLYYEAQCRIKDPIYGVVGIITDLHQQIHNTQTQLAKIQAQLAIISADHEQHRYQQQQQQQQLEVNPGFANFMTAQDGDGVFSSAYDPSHVLAFLEE